MSRLLLGYVIASGLIAAVMLTEISAWIWPGTGLYGCCC
jgi:hypothetical protein